MTPASPGTHFYDNIVQNNIIGLDLANASNSDQAQIEGNLFQNNTNPGAGGGQDIYADQYTAGTGGVNDVLIQDNTFTNTSFQESSWGVGIGNTDPMLFQDISIVGNTFSNAGRGMYFYNSTGVTIDANAVTGATHYAIGLFGDTDTNFDIGRNTLNGNGDGIDLYGDVTGLSVHNNFIDGNSGDGIYIDPTVTVTTGGITVYINSIAGNTHAGLENDSSVNVNADFNWWGSASGPTNGANPSGTGDKIIDPNSNVTFSPWLSDGIDSQPAVPGFQHDTTSSAVSINGSSSAVEGSNYVLNLSPSSDIMSWDINWGDGHTDFGVSGTSTTATHVYEEEGRYTISAVAHTTSSGDINSNTVNVSVADAALTAGALTPPVATEGAHFTNIQLFHFTDADPHAVASDYTATITWGDGSTSVVTSAPAPTGRSSAISPTASTSSAATPIWKKPPD